MQVHIPGGKSRKEFNPPPSPARAVSFRVAMWTAETVEGAKDEIMSHKWWRLKLKIMKFFLRKGMTLRTGKKIFFRK